jgi:hypothetical protein
MNGVAAAAGIGQGWGFSNVGFAVFLERVEEISDEEYERRRNNSVPVTASPSVAPPPLQLRQFSQRPRDGKCA